MLKVPFRAPVFEDGIVGECASFQYGTGALGSRISAHLLISDRGSSNNAGFTAFYQRIRAIPATTGTTRSQAVLTIRRPDSLAPEPAANSIPNPVQARTK